ncbi:Oxoglutarate/iron-dependent dioxygenase [Parasponia andersonii]|uniref:Oxoglutarate/iron-dependent dioxygenase n=1 Tax=Parasponia andersonii TaxID=3476 RepID=A0A2P5DD73_PARAD|nr:Oxoglutarate/iron-dependent dioxygenase [Parasponia andersonii]
MGSQTDHKIPTVDFSNEENLKPGSDSWALACKQVRYGLEEYGCFQAVYDKIPTQVYDSAFLAAQELFDLPTETKIQKTSEIPGPNYVGQNFNLSMYESLVLDEPSTFEGAESFTKIMWPMGNDNFRESVRSFSKPVEELYQRAARIVFDSFGVGRLHESNVESTVFRLRLFRYNAPQANQAEEGLPTHTDVSFITVLHQHQVKGLQVKTKDDQYIDIKPNLSSFLFMAGDPFLAWSNGRARACVHRVMLEERKVRYSFGFNSFIKGLLHVPQEMVDEKYPLRYEPIDHYKFVNDVFADGGKRYSTNPIKATDV